MRLEAAAIIRDAALKLLRERGSWQPARVATTTIQVMGCRHGALTISHNTPFTRLPEVSQQLKYFAALLDHQEVANGRRGRNLARMERSAYQLDIWLDGKGKVLNLSWEADGGIEIVRFKRGSWEDDFTLET